jgi:hypothetical protein
MTNITYLSIGIFIRHSNGSETTVNSPGFAKITVPSSTGHVNGTGNPTITSMVATDSVVVRIYGSADGVTWTELKDVSTLYLADFQTTQLGANQLNGGAGVTWTVVYYFLHSGGGTFLYWGYAGAPYQTQIQGFSWTPIPTVILRAPKLLKIGGITIFTALTKIGLWRRRA